MKRIWVVLFALLTMVVGVSWADTPAFIDEESFPTFGKPLTAAQQAHLGLSAKILREPMEILNRVGPSNYRFARLEPGDVVFVDREGHPRYKASCGNRIEPVPVKTTIVYPTTPAPEAASATTKMWRRILLLMMVLLAAALIAAGIYLIGEVLNWIRRRTTPPIPGPTIVPAPAPVVTPPVMPTPVPPAPAVTPPPLPAHPLFLWIIRNGSVEWDTALVASAIESGVGPDGSTTLEIRLTARPPAPAATP